MFTKRELVHLIISIVVLGFIFGFDDGNPTFILGDWLVNFFRLILVVAIALLFRELIVKLVARRHDAKSEYETWNMSRAWFGGKGKLPKGFPFGIIIAFVLAIASKGNVFFTAIGSHKLEEIKSARVGRKHPTLNYYEEMQIAASGILSSLILAVIGIIIGRIFDVDVSSFITVNFFIALFNMIPFSSLDGAKIFFGSLLTWIFLLIFIFVAFLLIKFVVVWGLIAAFLLASIGTILYFYYYEK